MFEIKYARPEDLTSWMRLVRAVSRDFPGLETEESLIGHERTVLKNMERGSAICAAQGNVIVGVLLFSKKHNMLSCLAVAPECRRLGIARAMIAEMLKNLDPARDIAVTTFREGDEKGIAPRALYKKLGFEEGELVEEFGYPNQRFIRRAR
ncbi:MAG TPA: GNAT family N-acetyltransferase [Clostridia bacterium]|nr:GNAT family N-acetyltransferase [Clostridia bacterium]